MKCIVYCRVSSARQAIEGNGLESQEQRCRQHAKSKGWEVVKVFHDSAVSGGVLERLGIQNLVAYLTKQKQEVVVLADDISRFARDTLVFALLKKTFVDLGAQMQTVNLGMDDTPESSLIQSIMSSAAAYEREKNRLQVIARTKARLEMGFWTLQPPLGYKTIYTKDRGKVSMPDGVNSVSVQKMLKKVAAGELTLRGDMVAYLTREGIVDRHGIPKPCTYNLLRRTLGYAWFYAGFIQFPKWDVSLRKGQHEALITMSEYHRILALKDTSKRAISKRVTAERFPLRGFIYCACCGKGYYSGTSGGRYSCYDYYFCRGYNCSMKNVNYKGSEIHNQFSSFLHSIQPTDQDVSDFVSVLKEYSNKHGDLLQKERDELCLQLEACDGEVEKVFNNIDKLSSAKMTEFMEKRLSQVEEQRVLLQSKVDELENRKLDFDIDILPKVEKFRNFAKGWQNACWERKREIQSMVCPHGALYDAENGFRNRETPLLLSCLGGFREEDYRMVDREGFEPPTQGASILCSTN